MYDSPHTRSLLDTKTHVYYAADAFCAPMPAEPVDRVDQMPALMWERGMAMVHHYSLCPWISMVDEAKFQTEVKKLAGLGVEVIVGAHTPLISASSIERAFDQLAALPSTIPPRMSASGVDLLVTARSRSTAGTLRAPWPGWKGASRRRRTGDSMVTLGSVPLAVAG